jgi:hypothetical protein
MYHHIKFQKMFVLSQKHWVLEKSHFKKNQTVDKEYFWRERERESV